jgi:hypothetical protein
LRSLDHVIEAGLVIVSDTARQPVERMIAAADSEATYETVRLDRTA